MTVALEADLAAYLPLDRRKAIAANAELELVQQGTVVFADLAGFTSLTRRASEELGGHAGADALTEALEEVFGAVADPVTDWGGSIVEFLGDAFVAWFPGDGAASAAVEASRTMQVSIADLSPVVIGDVEHRLGLKIGVATGQAIRFWLGDPKQLRFESLAGDALEAALVCESMCDQGEIVVDAVTLAAASLVPSEVRITDSSQVFAIVEQLPAPAPMASELPMVSAVEALAGVPGPVRRAVASGLVEADIRPGTSLFMSFSGVDPQVRGVDELAEVTLWAQSIVSAQGGVLIRSGSGDKGLHLLASFGAPVAVERMEEQALAAAEVLLTAGDFFDKVVDVRIGLASGPVYSGAYGGRTRRTVSVLGSSVNLAARLMGRAQSGTALVAEPMAVRLLGRHDFGPAELFELKGFEQPVTARRLQRAETSAARKATSRAAVRLVGRVEELASAAAHLDAPDGTSPLLIAGEAGIGKSRIIAAVLRAAAQRQMPALVGAADVTQRLAPYHAFRSVFRQLLSVDEPITEREVVAMLSMLAADHDVEKLAPQLATVLPMITDESPSRAGPPEDVSGAILDLLCGIVKQALSRVARALLVLDDAHWFDPSSWSLVAELAKNVPNLRIVLASRSADETIDLDAQVVTLGPLPLEGALMLAAEVFGASELDADLADKFVRRSGGQPLFVVEMAGALAASGAVTVTKGVAALTEGGADDGALPNSLREVVLGRVDRLDPSARQVLRAASVLGLAGGLDALQAVVPEVLDDFSDVLTRLHNESLLDVHYETWSFRHALFADVILESMLDRQRRELNARSASFFEAHPGRVSSATLAGHYEAAGNVDGAMPHLLAAVAASISVGAFDKSRDLTVHAVELLGDRNDDVAARMKLQFLVARGSAALVSAGQSAPEVRAAYDEALEVSKQLEATPDLLGVLFGLSAHYTMRGELTVAQSLASQCLDLSTSLGVADGEESAHMLLHLIEQWKANFAEADRHGEAILANDRAEGDENVLARFAQHPSMTVSIAHAHGLAIRARPVEAQALVENALALAERLDHQYSLAQAYQAEALMALEQRELERAEAAAQKMSEISSELGVAPFIAIAQAIRGASIGYRGDYESAIELLEEAAASWELGGSRLAMTFFGVLRAECLLMAGRVEEAIEVVQDALDGTETEERLYLPEMLRIRGQALAMRIALVPGQDRESLEAAVAVARDSGAVLHEVRASVALANFHAANQNPSEAESVLRSALARVDAPGANALADVVTALELLGPQPD